MPAALDATVVFGRCAETGGLQSVRDLRDVARYRIYQKSGSCNESSRGTRTLFQLPKTSIRWLDHNAGDESQNCVVRPCVHHHNPNPYRAIALSPWPDS